MAKISEEGLAMVVRGYEIAALWSSTDESTPSGGYALDDNYDRDDIDSQTHNEMEADCGSFISDLSDEDFSLYVDTLGYEHFGHDFWLTRNGHGVGFWDRGLDELGDRLTDACKIYGEYNLYVGDDGKVYGQ